MKCMNAMAGNMYQKTCPQLTKRVNELEDELAAEKVRGEGREDIISDMFEALLDIAKGDGLECDKEDAWDAIKRMQADMVKYEEAK